MNDNNRNSLEIEKSKETPQIYLTLKEAVRVLSEHNIHTDISQLLRAASTDSYGVKRLPFFKDPIDGYYRIGKSDLLSHYEMLQSQAQEMVKIWHDTWE